MVIFLVLIVLRNKNNLIQPLQFCSKAKHGLLFKEGLINCHYQVSSELL